jgi:hypothetical protein
MERVLNIGGGDHSNMEVIDLGMTPWSAGAVTSAAQATRYPSPESNDRSTENR